MRKKILLIVYMTVLCVLCACGLSDSKEESKAQEYEVTDDADKFVRTDEMPDADMITDADAITDAEETAEPADLQEREQEMAQELSAEEVSQKEPEAGESGSVFENIATELNGYPILKYTLMGDTQTIEYKQSNPMYEMLSGPEGAISYTIGDVTGDGLEELIVSIYVVGNNLSDMWQDTYIYEIDADTNTLTETLFISATGCEQYTPGFPNNFGGVANSDGNLLLTVATNDYGFDKPSFSKTVVLACENGMWKVKE